MISLHVASGLVHATFTRGDAVNWDVISDPKLFGVSIRASCITWAGHRTARVLGVDSPRYLVLWRVVQRHKRVLAWRVLKKSK